MKCFLIDPNEIALDTMDVGMSDVGVRLRLKMQGEFFGAGQPSQADRISGAHPKLEGRTWRPNQWRRHTNGRDWIMDLEKVRT